MGFFFAMAWLALAIVILIIGQDEGNEILLGIAAIMIVMCAAISGL